jgi:hypothetical protein
MATYNGFAIFGSAVSMSTADNTRESQTNTFFGLSGLETLDGGFRGRLTRVRGVLSGISALGLAEAEGLFRSYNDGVARLLVDTSGTAWPNVKLRTFQPQGRVRQSINGTFFRAYQATFQHLV